MKLRRIMCLLLAVVLLLTVVPCGFAVAPDGDVDFDGEVTPEDARLTLRCAVQLEPITAQLLAAGDMDMDGAITAEDARLILRASVGLQERNNDPEATDPNVTNPDVTVPDDDYPVVTDPPYRYSEKYETFKVKLYQVSHPLVGTYKPVFKYTILKKFQKWCCYHTIHDVFRPTLEQSGYTTAEINALAPNKYTRTQLSKALKGGLAIKNYPEALIPTNVEYYVPSLLMNHYYINPQICDIYNLYDYYDDVIEQQMYYRDERDVAAYTPHIGDVLFMSNKTRTYEYGYPTIDHTAQIVEVYPDGTFMCTEGSIIENAENDGVAKVRERTYHYNPTVGTYEFDFNEVVIVLTAVRPYL